MSKITITIDTSNAAFEDDESVEVARILRNAAQRIEFCGDRAEGPLRNAAQRIEFCGDRAEGPLRDINGNTVGQMVIDTED